MFIYKTTQRYSLLKVKMQALSTSVRAQYFIETHELADMLQSNKNLKIVNATWYMPNSGKDAKKEHLEARITPGTVFFDHDEICDKSINLPHTMPTLEIFTDNMRKLGIQRNHDIVCYDTQGMFSVARAAWMLRYFGAQNVRILNGGLKKWIKEDRPLAKNAAQQPVSADGDFGFSVKDPSRCILDIKQMHSVAKELYHGGSSGKVQVLDARSADRFNAKVAEPRPGVRSGSIRNSINVPFNLLVNEDGTFKSE